MKIFMTGGTGFIGKVVVEKLLKLGHQIICLARPETGRCDPARIQKPGVTVVLGDVVNLDGTTQAMRGVDCVLHAAAWNEFGPVQKDLMYRINVEGTRGILSAAQRFGVPKVVYVSSTAALGNTNDRRVDEEFVRTDRFRSIYEWTKTLAHREADKLQEAGLPLVRVMPCMVYGPEDPSAIGRFIRIYLRKELPLMLNSNAIIDYIYVNDVAEGIVRAIEQGRVGAKYILAGEDIGWSRLVDTLEKIAGIPRPKLSLGPKMAMPVAALCELVARMSKGIPMVARETVNYFDRYSQLFDTSKARKELGWTPTPFDQAFGETVRWFQENPTA